MASTVTRLNITLPSDLVVELRETVSPRARSRLIAEALREKLAERDRKEAMVKLKGSWDRFGGIKFAKEKELRAWRRSLWASTEKRLGKKLHG